MLFFLIFPRGQQGGALFGTLDVPFALLIYLSLIFSSPDMPENEATFAISAGGVTDAKEWRTTGRETHVSAGLPHSDQFNLFIEFNNILNWESCSVTFKVLYLKPLFYFCSVS